jgi:arylformamidase
VGAVSLDRDYSPSTCVADLRVYLEEYARRSRAARAAGYRRLRYGTRPEQVADLFPGDSPDAPLMVYVHGGYWQELGREESAFAAADFRREGMAFAALGYGLAPRYPLDEIVAMVREGVRWLTARARGPVHLSGSSAGAHLVTMALLDGPPVAGAVLLSGVYELGELRHTYVNAALGLDAAAAARNSPLRRLPDRLPPLVVAVGDNETAAFTRQHHGFVAAAGSRTPELVSFIARGRNHFDLPLDLGRRGTPLGDPVLALMRR